MIESLKNLDLIKAIDEKMNFPERRKAGTTQAHCVVKNFFTKEQYLYCFLQGGPF